jgi:hypothetical protein
MHELMLRMNGKMRISGHVYSQKPQNAGLKVCFVQLFPDYNREARNP